MKIKAKVDCNDEEYITDEIDISPITKEQINAYCAGEYLDIFQNKHRVPDVWRYIVEVGNADINIIPVDKYSCIEKPAKSAERTTVRTTQYERISGLRTSQWSESR